jgi:hypothetical protein
MLSDEVLLIIFDFCRLAAGEKFNDASYEGNWNLNQSRWWHKLTQICQRWRSLILSSPSRLNLRVVCTKGTPVEEMFAYFPHLPLDVNYVFQQGEKIRPDDERNILLSLQRRHHVRRIRLNAPTLALQNMVIPLGEEFPLLDRLSITSECVFARVTLPKSLRAPNLRYLILRNVTLQTGTPILTTSKWLVSLTLWDIPTSTHILPEYLVGLLELTPHLRALSVSFRFHISDSSVGTSLPLALEAQKTIIILRCLEQVDFTGDSTYLEGILARIIAPALRKFSIYISDQRSYGALPNLSRFLDATTEFSFRVALINFRKDGVTIDSGDMRPHRGSKLPFYLSAWVEPLSWHTASVSNICSAIGPVFSGTEELIFGGYPEEDADCINWHTILRQFSNVKTLKVPDQLVEELSLSLEPDREGALGLLPKLQQIVVPRDVEDDFDEFIDSRRIAGHPVNLVRMRWQ